jgi:hypothetical protein
MTKELAKKSKAPFVMKLVALTAIVGIIRLAIRAWNGDSKLWEN